MRQDSLLGRAVVRVSGSAAFAKVAPKFIPHIDRFVDKVTGGRFVMSSGMLPSLVLTTTGAKSGQPRTTPLATMPLDDDRFIVVGSNFGRESHPAWTANLLKNPRAEVSFRGRRIPVEAHLLTEQEKSDMWPKLVAMWPNYEVYTERSGRSLRVFRLEATNAR